MKYQRMRIQISPYVGWVRLWPLTSAPEFLMAALNIYVSCGHYRELQIMRLFSLFPDLSNHKVPKASWMALQVNEWCSFATSRNKPILNVKLVLQDWKSLVASKKWSWCKHGKEETYKNKLDDVDFILTHRLDNFAEDTFLGPVPWSVKRASWTNSSLRFSTD